MAFQEVNFLCLSDVNRDESVRIQQSPPFFHFGLANSGDVNPFKESLSEILFHSIFIVCCIAANLFAVTGFPLSLISLALITALFSQWPQQLH